MRKVRIPIYILSNWVRVIYYCELVVFYLVNSKFYEFTKKAKYLLFEIRLMVKYKKYSVNKKTYPRKRIYKMGISVTISNQWNTLKVKPLLSNLKNNVNWASTLVTLTRHKSIYWSWSGQIFRIERKLEPEIDFSHSRYSS